VVIKNNTMMYGNACNVPNEVPSHTKKGKSVDQMIFKEGTTFCVI